MLPFCLAFSPSLMACLKQQNCMEIAFVFYTIHRNEQYNGGTPELMPLPQNVSKTWATFAENRQFLTTMF
jgi:hypothetical protein